jgi:integrase
VAEVILAFWRHAERHYRHEDGSPTSEVRNYRFSLRPLRELYAAVPAVELGPLKLKAVRQKMIGSGWCRRLINQRVARIVRMFKWAVAEELVPPSVYQALKAVLRRAKRRPRRVPGEHYSPASYYAAVRRACLKAGVAPWHPHQLRHTHATEVRRAFGLEAAQVALGHAQANVTQVYAERDLALAVRVAAELG